jgi:hypothetical protein
MSVSTDAAGVLAGLLPSDLEIEKVNTLRALKRGKDSLFQGELIITGMFDSIPHAALYLQLRAEDIWQTRWDSSIKGRITYAFLPTDIATLPVLEFVRAQILTGHGEFGCHLHRIGKADSDLCETCRDATDDPIHRMDAGKLRTWLKLFRGFDQVAATKGLASFKCCSDFQRMSHFILSLQ